MIVMPPQIINVPTCPNCQQPFDKGPTAEQALFVVVVILVFAYVFFGFVSGAIDHVDCGASLFDRALRANPGHWLGYVLSYDPNHIQLCEE